MSGVNSEIELIELSAFKHARLYTLARFPDIGLIEAIATYIPIESFQEIFRAMGEFVAAKKLTTLIFDKRKLKVFHQPSMEWYFVEWKAEMAVEGLINHFKILPDDNVFRQSVKLGREKISKEHPHARYKELNIQYADSIEEVLRLLGR